jgi:hypothetical protein
VTRCWCGRPAPHDSACGCCCAEHDSDDAHTLARVRALVTEHPDTQVPIVALDDLRRALGDQ